MLSKTQRIKAEMTALATQLEHESELWRSPAMQRTRWRCRHAAEAVREYAGSVSQDDIAAAEIWRDEARALLLRTRNQRVRLAALQQGKEQRHPSLVAA